MSYSILNIGATGSGKTYFVKNDVIAFHITAHTSDKNFTKCVLTKIKKDKTTEVINFDMNLVDFETLLK